MCSLVADTDGLVKVISDAKTDRILGVHIVGSVSHSLISVYTPSHAHTHTHTHTHTHMHTLYHYDVEGREVKGGTKMEKYVKHVCFHVNFKQESTKTFTFPCKFSFYCLSS